MRATRTLIATVAVCGMALAACGGDDDTAEPTSAETSAESSTEPSIASTDPPSTETSSAAPDDTAWSFTDDLGDTVELASPPQRIVMFEDVAASLMDFGITPVGIHYLQGDGNNAVMDGLDTTGIANVGEMCGEPNLEAVAAADPDLFVYMHWGGAPEETFCLDAHRDTFLEIAPIVQIEAEGSADQILTRYAALAEALGADLDSADLVAKRERYEAAAERLQAAVAARPEISVLPASISPEWAGVAEPGGFADLVSLRDTFGVTFEGPFTEPFTETYWQEYTAETLHEVRGDVVLMDAKNATPQEAKEQTFPLWAALPEVEAGQIVEWFVPGSFSYTRDAAFMESLAAAIENAEDFVQ